MNDQAEFGGRPAVVLIVEDEPLLRMLAADMLSDEGFVAIEAEKATAALDICKVRAQEIDVLFTDVRMPESMDGLELAHRVRDRWPWIAVVITSANIFVSPRELPAGTRFLPKPYDMQRVVDLIREVRRR